MAFMWLRRLRAIISIFSIVFFVGCATIGARATTKNPPPFAGLKADFYTFRELLSNKEEVEPLWYWLGLPLISSIILVDVPVSAIFDVLCLPADLKSQKEETQKKEKDKDQGHTQ